MTRLHRLPLRDHLAAPPSARTRRPMVVIVGLLSDQQHRIEQKIGHLADLRFVDKNRSSNHLPAGADLYVCWLKYVRHSHSDAAKRLALRGHYVGIHGGLNELINATVKKLREIQKG